MAADGLDTATVLVLACPTDVRTLSPSAADAAGRRPASSTAVMRIAVTVLSGFIDRTSVSAAGTHGVQGLFDGVDIPGGQAIPVFFGPQDLGAERA